MSRDEIRKLMGGYATGTLTPAEQETLFEAALNDQELFEELAREQPLRDLLREPTAKAHVLAALDERRVPWYRRWQTWTATAVAMATVVVVGVVMRPQKPVEVAQVRELDKLTAPAPKPAEPAITQAKPAAPAARVKSEPRRAMVDERPQLTERGSQIPVRPEIPPPPPVPQPAAAPPPIPEQLAKAEAAVPDAQAPAPVQNSPANSFVQNENAATGPREQQMRYQQALNSYRAPGAAGGIAAENPGVRYTILRRSDTGAFVEAKADDLKAGDVVQLKFETNQSGTLTVTEAGKSRALAFQVMRPTTPFTTRALPAGIGELAVTFTTGGAATGTVSFENRELKQTTTSPNSVFVAGARQGQPVTFTIRLNYR